MSEPRSLPAALWRGFKGHCPRCGEGKLFRAYLKVKERCDACDLALDRYRADDGPAYFTMLIIGHLVIAPLLFFPFVWQWPAAVVLPLTLIPLLVLTLVLLPRVKGAFVALMWSHKVGADDHGPRSEFAASAVEPPRKP